MIKKILITLLAAIITTNSLYAQSCNKVSFTLEELDAPAGLLKTRTVDDIYKHLLRKDYKSYMGSVDEIASQSKIIANSLGDRQIVGKYGYNPFFFGLCEALSFRLSEAHGEIRFPRNA